MIKPFPHYQQLDSMDCGPSCLRMIAKYYGRSYSLQNLRETLIPQHFDLTLFISS